MAIELSEKQLAELEQMAGLMLPLEDIAICMGVSLPDLVDQIARENSPASIAFRRGSLTTEIKLRNSIIRLANQGSSPAQTLAMKLQDQFNVNKAKHNL